MKELLAPHWVIGAVVSVGGALAFRLGPRFVSGTSLAVLQVTGLVAVAIGLFIVMRGVSRAAQERPLLEGKEAERRIPGLHRRAGNDEKK
jgi:hypothetical protein